MDMKIIASELVKIAKELMADSDYIYDPEHKKHPSGGYTKTEKGWTKNKKEETNSSGESKKVAPKTKMTDEQKHLDKLSKSKDSDERLSVAENENTSPDILDKLSQDENNEVRYSVSCNEKTKSETLDKLSNDKDVNVRLGVANNNSTSTETLDKMSNDKKWSVRYYVAQNPHTHENTLYRLCDDKNEDVADAASKSLNMRRKKHLKGIEESKKNRPAPWSEDDVYKYHYSSEE